MVLKSLLPFRITSRNGRRYLAVGNKSIPFEGSTLLALGECIEHALQADTAEFWPEIEESALRYPEQWNAALDGFRTTLGSVGDESLQAWLRNSQYDSVLSILRPLDHYPALQSVIVNNMAGLAGEMLIEDLANFAAPSGIVENQLGALIAFVSDGAVLPIDLPLNNVECQRENVSIAPVANGFFQLKVEGLSLLLGAHELRLLLPLMRLCHEAMGKDLEFAVLRHCLDRCSSQSTAFHLAALKRMSPELVIDILRFSRSERLERAWCALCSPAAAQWVKQQLSKTPSLAVCPPSVANWLKWNRPW